METEIQLQESLGRVQYSHKRAKTLKGSFRLFDVGLVEAFGVDIIVPAADCSLNGLSLKETKIFYFGLN